MWKFVGNYDIALSGCFDKSPKDGVVDINTPPSFGFDDNFLTSCRLGAIKTKVLRRTGSSLFPNNEKKQGPPEGFNVMAHAFTTLNSKLPENTTKLVSLSGDELTHEVMRGMLANWYEEDAVAGQVDSDLLVGFRNATDDDWRKLREKLKIDVWVVSVVSVEEKKDGKVTGVKVYINGPASMPEIKTSGLGASITGTWTGKSPYPPIILVRHWHNGHDPTPGQYYSLDFKRHKPVQKVKTSTGTKRKLPQRITSQTKPKVV